jgi:hypothetical protein
MIKEELVKMEHQGKLCDTSVFSQSNNKYELFINRWNGLLGVWFVDLEVFQIGVI